MNQAPHPAFPDQLWCAGRCLGAGATEVNQAGQVNPHPGVGGWGTPGLMVEGKGVGVGTGVRLGQGWGAGAGRQGGGPQKMRGKRIEGKGLNLEEQGLSGLQKGGGAFHTEETGMCEDVEYYGTADVAWGQNVLVQRAERLEPG